jgi:hypothetical protein
MGVRTGDRLMFLLCSSLVEVLGVGFPLDSIVLHKTLAPTKNQCFA